MRKTLLFAVVLLLTLTLPTVSAIHPHYSQRTVRFADDIEGEALLEVWDPSSKIVIEWESINLTYEVIIVGTESTNFTKLSEEWLDEYEDSFERWNGIYGMSLNDFGWLYLRVFKNKGNAKIVYRFGRYEAPLEFTDGYFRYRLEGSGAWSDGLITADGSFTIYEISYKQKGKKGLRETFDPLWTGPLSFTIEIV